MIALNVCCMTSFGFLYILLPNSSRTVISLFLYHLPWWIPYRGFLYLSNASSIKKTSFPREYTGYIFFSWVIQACRYISETKSLLVEKLCLSSHDLISSQILFSLWAWALRAHRVAVPGWPRQGSMPLLTWGSWVWAPCWEGPLLGDCARKDMT